MDQNDRLRDLDAEYQHRGCGASVSVGAYGEWHYCEACEMTQARARPRLRESICLPIKA
jgi:hypothetical protein